MKISNRIKRIQRQLAQAKAIRKTKLRAYREMMERQAEELLNAGKRADIAALEKLEREASYYLRSIQALGPLKPLFKRTTAYARKMADAAKAFEERDTVHSTGLGAKELKEFRQLLSIYIGYIDAGYKVNAAKLNRVESRLFKLFTLLKD